MVQTKPLKTSRSPVKGPQSVCEGPGDRFVLGHGRVGDRNEIPRYDVLNSVPNCEEGGHLSTPSLLPFSAGFFQCSYCTGLDLRGPYCFLNGDFFVPNDGILHCLNIPQNSPNLEYKSHTI